MFQKVYTILILRLKHKNSLLEDHTQFVKVFLILENHLFKFSAQ